MMVQTIVICCLLTLGYAALMVLYRIGWSRQDAFVLPPEFRPVTFISVIVPARNERRTIGGCIESILSQQYPTDLFEIIVVDDHSDDGTYDIVAEYADRNVRGIKLAEHVDAGRKINAYKKAAIAVGIAHSRGTLIVTTDADCHAPNSWLLHIAAIYERDKPVMVVAPVIYSSDDSILQLFQITDFMSMQGITAAALALRLGRMSNGANLAFTKAAFEAVGGYDKIDHLASGDDYLLMMKLNEIAPGHISYLKSQHAIVNTGPQPTLAAFLQQRIRWASKSGKYNDVRLTLILLMVYLFNVSLIGVFIAANFHPAFLYLGFGMLAVKIVTEYMFLLPVSRFFGHSWVLKYFPFLQPLHIVYIVVAGFLGFVGNYEWKGRRVK